MQDFIPKTLLHTFTRNEKNALLIVKLEAISMYTNAKLRHKEVGTANKAEVVSHVLHHFVPNRLLGADFGYTQL